MEQVSVQLDIQEHSFLCLICGSSVDESDQLANNSKLRCSGISKQLNVIFILKNLLQLPNNQLAKFVKNYGNPESWISLCDQCTQLTSEARDLHLQIVEITGKLKGYQKLIVEKVKSTADTLPDDDDEEGRSKVDKGEDTPKMRIWKETRIFVKYFLDIDDDLCQEDPILEANKLIQNLESHLQNPTNPHPPPSPFQDNYEDNFEDLSPGTPESPPPSPDQDNQNESSSKPRTPFVGEPQKCPQCSLQFPRVTPLLRHLQTVHGVVKLPCLHQQGCQKTLASIKQYFKHRQRHLKKESEQLAKPADHNGQVTVKEQDQVVNDDLQDNPTEHIPDKVTETPSIPPSISTPEIHKCPRCSLSFPTITATFHHMSTIHKLQRLPCLHPGCRITVKNVKQYFSHRQQHLDPSHKRNTTPAAPWVTGQSILCDLCGASFKHRKYLKHHLTFVHERRPRKRVYRDCTCHICGMIMKATHRKIHMLRKHRDAWVEDEDKKLFQCVVVGCKRWYIKKESLDKHIEKTHGGWDGTGEPPKEEKPTFECKVCGMGFYFEGRLVIHELTHGDKAKQFSCDLCGKKFGTEKHLDNHIKFKKCRMAERIME